jgi:hypothetical protein
MVKTKKKTSPMAVNATRLQKDESTRLRKAARILKCTPSELLRNAWLDYAAYNKIDELIEADAKARAEKRARRAK